MIFTPLRCRLVVVSALLCLGALACERSGDAATAKEVRNDSITAVRNIAAAQEATSFALPPYDLDAPTARFGLPLFLKEISGITVLDDNTLGAIEDETASLYRIDMTTGEAVRSANFGVAGDYEDLVRVGERLFALRSDATVHELVGWASGKIELHELFGSLAARTCDTESLGSDGRQLIVVCKNPSATGGNAAYAVDLAKASFGESPLFEIETGKGFLEGGLRPSGIAWHPQLKRWVMISAKREALIVLDTLGRIEEAWNIKPLKLEQPEGIAFMPNGDLWLSSEGKVGTGGVVRFTYQRR